MRRWCTEHLKIKALKSFFKESDLVLPVNTVGVRAAESAYRSKLPERELSTSLDCMVWRPILHWTKQDVVDIHTRHQVKPCSLYLNGADRVGCWPCIFSRKSEVRYLAETDQVRIDLIRDLEADVQRLKNNWNIAKHGMTTDERGHEPPTFFSDKGGLNMASIDQAVEWSKTSRGGKQFSMFREDQIEPGCMSWGLCDTGDSVSG
tara:strand:- start:299 stop:913 length:615 start_codon:yes stop_codon:yes gene_type:complete